MMRNNGYCRLALVALLMVFPLFVQHADAKTFKLGLKGGMNLTQMSFNSKVWKPENRNGFFIGPTLKIDLPLGFDIDASALYNQMEADSELYMTPNDGSPSDETFPTLKRKTFAIPLNLRKGFGFGDKLDVFFFAGPQFDYNLGGDIKEQGVTWKWRDSALSINVGIGMMLLNHLEVKANYNIPCGTTGEFDKQGTVDTVHEAIKGKTAAWQLGLAYYF